MAIDKQTLAAANKYTKKTVEGAGAIKGKNCTIQSIIPMPTIHETEVTFAWYEDGASLPTISKMMVPDGAQGPQGEQGEDGEAGLGIKSVDIDSNRHLIVTYDDDTTHDAGVIPGGGGPGEIDTELDPTSTNAVENRAIAIPIAALQASMLTKAKQADISRIDLSISQLQGSLLNKVDKEAGKGLSTNDFSDIYKSKLEALLGIKSAGAGLNFDPTTGELTATGTSIEIDTELDPTSVHPVQNKAIAIPVQALQASMLTKANKSDISRIDLDIDQLQGSLLTKAEQTDINRIDLSISQLQGSLLTKASKSELPTKVSDLNNDSGFVTNTVNNLINYYLKSEVYTKADVDTLISTVSSLDIQVVATLPTTDISRTTIYLLPKSTSQTSNVYDEYINLDGTTAGWEKIGDTQIDLSNYVTNDDLTAALANYTTTANLTTLLAAKQDTISDLATIRSGAASGATAYHKPSTGIPKTDLDSAVQTSLGKADTALQSHQSLANYYQTGDTAETDLQDGDYIPFYDASASAKRKTLWSNIKAKLKSYFDGIYSTVRSRQTPTSGGTTLSLVNTGDMYSWNNKATVNGHTMAPTPASGLTETTVVSTVKGAAANNAQVPSLYGVQKWTNEKKVRRTISGASKIGSTGIGKWTDKDVSSITTSDEADWWYDAAFKIPDNANDIDIDFKFDPTGSLVAVGGYILDTTTGKLCVKFANTVDPATTKFAVDITYTRNEVS